MATILEGTNYCPLCPHAELHKKPLFGNLSLSGVDLVMDSSSFARSLISSIDATTQRADPPSFSALGLTTVFSLVGGAVALHDGLHDKALMEKIKDYTGKIFSYLKCARAGIQTVAGALYIPVRGLSVGAYMSGSKLLGNLSGLLGQIGSGLFSGVGLLVSISTFMEIDEFSTFAARLDYVAKRASGKSEQGKAEACLAFLKGKLALSAEEQASPDRKAILEGKRSILCRLLTPELVQRIESATAHDALEIQALVSDQNAQAIFAASATFFLCILGIAATVIALATSSPTAVLVSTSINTFTALCSFVSSLLKVKEALQHSTTGRYDGTLLLALSAVCALAVTLTPLLPEEQLFQIITGSLTLFWLTLNLYMLARVAREKKSKRTLITEL